MVFTCSQKVFIASIVLSGVVEIQSSTNVIHLNFHIVSNLCGNHEKLFNTIHKLFINFEKIHGEL
jgi:hypothetical protein